MLEVIGLAGTVTLEGVLVLMVIVGLEAGENVDEDVIEEDGKESERRSGWLAIYWSSAVAGRKKHGLLTKSIFFVDSLGTRLFIELPPPSFVHATTISSQLLALVGGTFRDQNVLRC